MKSQLAPAGGGGGGGWGSESRGARAAGRGERGTHEVGDKAMSTTKSGVHSHAQAGVHPHHSAPHASTVPERAKVSEEPHAHQSSGELPAFDSDKAQTRLRRIVERLGPEAVSRWSKGISEIRSVEDHDRVVSQLT